MQVKTQLDELQNYLVDASNMPGGHAEQVFFPESEAEVAEILREANRDGRAVTISGARTGTVGGAIPFGGSVVSLERMNRIISVDKHAMRAVVEPAVILADLMKAVETEGLFYPPDPTEWSCQIGGTVATNASGARSFKYGATRDYVERLRVVLADGDTVELRRGEIFADADGRISITTDGGRSIEAKLPTYKRPDVRKNVSGFFNAPGMDAIDQFIGSEGALGVITEIELRLVEKPKGSFSGIVFFADHKELMSFVDECKCLSFASRMNADGGVRGPKRADEGVRVPKRADEGVRVPKRADEGDGGPKRADGGDGGPEIADGGDGGPKRADEGDGGPKRADEGVRVPKSADGGVRGPERADEGDGGPESADGGVRGPIDATLIEYFDGQALEFIRERFPETPEGMAGAIFFEQETTEKNEDALFEAWNELLEKHSADIERSWFTTNEQDLERMREFRHALPVAVNERVVRNKQKKIGTDMSVPDANFAGFLKYYKEMLDASGIEYVIFGHIGDCHLHANLLPKDDAEAERSRHLYGRFVAQALMLGGCVSAEHGIGKLKAKYLYVMMGERYLNEMAELKRAFDPKGILGQGNIFGTERRAQFI